MQSQTARTEQVSKEKFHPIYDKFLKVAFEATFDSNINLEDIKVEGSSLTTEEEQTLTHTKYEFMKVYQPARIETADGVSKISFVPWVETDDVKFYRLVFRAKPLGYSFPVFARFGEEGTFGFSLDKPYINLDYFSLTGKFEPVYAKVIDRNKTSYLKIESQGMGILEISRVQESEVPPHLIRG